MEECVSEGMTAIQGSREKRSILAINREDKPRGLCHIRDLMAHDATGADIPLLLDSNLASSVLRLYGLPLRRKRAKQEGSCKGGPWSVREAFVINKRKFSLKYADSHRFLFSWPHPHSPAWK